MQKCITFFILLVGLMIAAGCIAGGSGTVTTATPAQEPTGIPTATATTSPVSMASLTEIRYTTVPTTVATTASPSKPMAAPVTLQGSAGDSSVSFTTVAPGKISVTWSYSSKRGTTGNTKCESQKTLARVFIEGKSIDSLLFTTGAAGGYTKTATFNLVTPGEYKIRTDGCYGWQAIIDNAE